MTTESDLLNMFIASLDSTESNVTKSVVHSDMRIKKLNSEKQIVYGEVYAPEVIDSHGDIMDASSVEDLAHNFLLASKNHNIDVMHNNKPIQASVVESFIARAGDPDYVEGAWVVATKIFDSVIWDGIKRGLYNGYSMEALVNKEKRIVDVNIQNQAFGLTEDNSGHTHAYYVEINDKGQVVGGSTSEENGHSHVIKSSSSTEFTNDHTHRYFLP